MSGFTLQPILTVLDKYNRVTVRLTCRNGLTLVVVDVYRMNMTTTDISHVNLHVHADHCVELLPYYTFPALDGSFAYRHVPVWVLEGLIDRNGGARIPS